MILKSGNYSASTFIIKKALIQEKSVNDNNAQEDPIKNYAKCIDFLTESRPLNHVFHIIFTLFIFIKYPRLDIEFLVISLALYSRYKSDIL